MLSHQLRRSSHPVVILDDERRFVDANQAACLLVERARVELLGLQVDELTPADRVGELRERWSDFMRDGVATGRWALRRHGEQVVSLEYFGMAGVGPHRHVVAGIAQDADGHPAGGSPQGAGAITGRERSVLVQLALGRTGPQIADELGISVDTVRTNIRLLKSKVGARTLPHLVAIALRDGLLEPDGR